MRTQSNTLYDDLENHPFSSEIYDGNSQKALRRILYNLLNKFMLDYPNNGIEFESWINMLYFGRKDIYDEKFHDHYTMNKANNRLIPDKSLVLYIQMPDLLCVCATCVGVNFNANLLQIPYEKIMGLKML